MSEVICYFKENNRQYVWPMINFKFSGKNEDFGKLVSIIVNLSASQ